MTATEATEKKPLWLLIEENILALDSQNLSGQGLETSIQGIAGELDNSGYNVSHHGGHMLELRRAVSDMVSVGRPFMKDFNAAIASLTLEDVSAPYVATDKLLSDLEETWPKINISERRPDVIAIIENRRLDLLIAKAKDMPDDTGIRFLIEKEVEFDVITNALEITDDKLNQVNAEVEAERAERARVASLLEAVADKTKEEQVKHLFEKKVSEELIVEMAGVGQGEIDAVKKAMEEEIKEQQRLAEEEAARKKAAAEGPSLDDIPADEMVDFIDAIREIMEFSDQEKEIRVMCEQSSIPKSLVDIAVSDPDKLDEMEKAAEG